MSAGRPRLRTGFILPVVLVIIGLLAVTLASFVFFVNAEMAGIQAHRDAQQAQLAAESGFEEVISVIRGAPEDPSAWYDVPDRFRNALVWSEAYTRDNDPVRQMGNRQEILAMAVPPVAWRYSVVAPNLDGPPQTIRFGITPESGKLNLNSASDGEIERLLTPLLLELRVQNAPELVAALLDWRDEDSDIRPGGAEDEYYTNLIPAYTTKNGPLDTIEEVLQVKGWTAAMLYGEDTNRNGLLDANEDDGDASFPDYDNGDGILNYGIAAFVTVWSREPGTPAQAQGQGQYQENGQGQDQAQQENAGGSAPQLEAPVDQNTPSQGQSGGTDKLGGTGVSPGGTGVSPASPTKSGKSEARQSSMNPTEKPPPGGAGVSPANGATPNAPPRASGGKPPAPAASPPPGLRSSGGQRPGFGSTRPPGPNMGQPPQFGRPPAGGGRPQRPGQLPQPGQPQLPGQPLPPTQSPAAGGAQTPDEAQPNTPTGGQPQGSGGQPATTGGMRVGLVNVNTAPLRVLQALDGMPEGGAEAIVAIRQELAADVLQSPDWIVTSGAVDAATYDQIKDRITTRALQFHVEIVGYGDHTKLARRYEWIIEMRGTVAQVLYHRDLTGLGFAWPIDDETTIVKGK
jgi:hypothetical protein